jgi:hypothetical protein
MIFKILQYKLFRFVTMARIFCVCLTCSRPAQNRMHHFANGRAVAFCGRSYCGSLNQSAKRSVGWPFAWSFSAGSLSNILYFITVYQQQKCEHLGTHWTIQIWNSCTASQCVVSPAPPNTADTVLQSPPPPNTVHTALYCTVQLYRECCLPKRP